MLRTTTAAVASTERALVLVARGDPSRYVIAWDRDPATVLNALLAGRPPGAAVPGAYRTVVSRDLPKMIAVEADKRPLPRRELRSSGSALRERHVSRPH
jgi:hypothetical protein